MAYQILSQIFAKREIRVVRVPLSRGCPAKKTAVPGVSECPPEQLSTLAPQYGAGGSVPSSSDDSTPLVSTLEIVQRSDSGLAGTKFGRAAREKLRRVGVAAEFLDPNPSNYWFLTVTYPTESLSGQSAISLNSGWIVKQLKNYLRRYESGDSTYFYAWERQGRGTLHLHFCAYLPSAASMGFSDSVFARWCQSHVHALSDRCGVNLWVGRGGNDWSSTPWILRSDAQKVRASVSRYLSKYVGKDAGRRSEAPSGFPAPRRWWGASQNLHEKVGELTVTFRELHQGYLSASNRFSELKAKLMLFFPAGVAFYNRLCDCDGESISLFKGVACLRLESFMKELQSRCKRSVARTSTTTSACPLELSDSLEKLKNFVTASAVLLKGSQVYDDCLEGLLNCGRSENSTPLNSAVMVRAVQASMKNLYISAFHSRRRGSSKAMKNLSYSWSALLWIMHRWEQSPPLMIETLSAYQVHILESQKEVEHEQLDLWS